MRKNYFLLTIENYNESLYVEECIGMSKKKSLEHLNYEYCSWMDSGLDDNYLIRLVKLIDISKFEEVFNKVHSFDFEDEQYVYDYKELNEFLNDETIFETLYVDEPDYEFDELKDEITFDYYDFFGDYHNNGTSIS